MNKDIGIYKITCPDGFIYIGQSKNINNRFNQYKRLGCQSQPKIYKSLIEKGVGQHKFEIIKNCKIENLNYWERYYQEKYDSVKTGLNSVYTTKNNKLIIMNELNKILIVIFLTFTLIFLVGTIYISDQNRIKSIKIEKKIIEIELDSLKNENFKINQENRYQKSEIKMYKNLIHEIIIKSNET